MTVGSMPDGGVYQLDGDAWQEQHAASASVEPGYSKDTRATTEALKTGHHFSRSWRVVIVLEVFDCGKMARYVPIVPLEPSFTNPRLHVPLASPNFVPLPLFEPPLTLTNTWASCFLLSYRACVRFDQVFERRLAQLTPLMRPNDGANLRLTNRALTDLQWRMRRREERQLASAEAALEGLDLSLLGDSEADDRCNDQGLGQATGGKSINHGLHGLEAVQYPGMSGPGASRDMTRRGSRQMLSWSSGMYGHRNHQRPGFGSQTQDQSKYSSKQQQSNERTDATAVSKRPITVGSRPGLEPYSYSSNYDYDEEVDGGAATPPASASRPTTGSMSLGKEKESLQGEQQQQQQQRPDDAMSYRSSKFSANLSEGETLVERGDRDRWSNKSRWSASVSSMIAGKAGSGGGGGGHGSRRASTSTVSMISVAASERPASGYAGSTLSGATNAAKESDVEVELQPWKGQ